MEITIKIRDWRRLPGMVVCLIWGMLLSAGVLSGAEEPKPADTITNTVTISNSGGIESLMPKFISKESFFEWLLKLGADSNQVFLLRNEEAMQRLAESMTEQNDENGKILHLVNQKNLAPFYTWTEKDGVFCDPDRVFSITNGVLRISGKQRGYLATRGLFSDYRLVAEYKWGTETWGSRKLKTRNSGLCVHGTGLDKVWMKSVEVQIAEGQTGDVVVLDGARLTVNGTTKMRSYDTFKRPGGGIVDDKVGFRAPDDLEKPHGEWNTIEILCQGSLIRVMVNGKTVLEGIGSTPNSGRILLQSNGAEIFFRKLDLYPLR